MQGKLHCASPDIQYADGPLNSQVSAVLHSKENTFKHTQKLQIMQSEMLALHNLV